MKSLLFPSLILLSLCSGCDQTKKTSDEDEPVAAAPAAADQPKPSQSNSTPTTPPKETTPEVAAQPTAQPTETFPDITPTVTLKTLWCNKRQEASGHDEVYLLLAGKKSDGTVIEGRPPVGLTWSLSSGGGGREQSLEGKYHPEGLWSGPLKDGESAEFSVILMEEDKTRLTGRMERIAGVVRDAIAMTNADDKTIDQTEKVIQRIQHAGANGEDMLGAFAVKLTNDKGKLVSNWQCVSGCIDQQFSTGKPAAFNGKRFDFNGEGAYYMATIDAELH